MGSGRYALGSALLRAVGREEKFGVDEMWPPDWQRIVANRTETRCWLIGGRLGQCSV